MDTLYKLPHNCYHIYTLNSLSNIDSTFFTRTQNNNLNYIQYIGYYCICYTQHRKNNYNLSHKYSSWCLVSMVASIGIFLKIGMTHSNCIKYNPHYLYIQYNLHHKLRINYYSNKIQLYTTCIYRCHSLCSSHLLNYRMNNLIHHC